MSARCSRLDIANRVSWCSCAIGMAMVVGPETSNSSFREAGMCEAVDEIVEQGELVLGHDVIVRLSLDAAPKSVYVDLQEFPYHGMDVDIVTACELQS